MNLRKITSMTLLVSALVLTLNSFVLYVVPEGRVAYWANWRFMWLNKSQWGEQHTTIGFLFGLAAILHIYYNWKPLVAYMKNKTRELRVLTGSFNVALVLTTIVVIGTYLQLPPMSTIIQISDHFKIRASETYGEPPYGHAEASPLRLFARREGIDLKRGLELLADAGIKVKNPHQSLKMIAEKNNTTPQQIYMLIQPASFKPVVSSELSGAEAFLNAPRTGWGRRKIDDICSKYDLDLHSILKGLAGKGVQAEKGQTLRQIAEANDTRPSHIYELMVEIVSATQKNNK